MPQNARNKRKLNWSKLYSFKNCLKSSKESYPPQLLEGPGFSRVVYCNNPDLHRKKPLKYPSNYVSTTKYTVISFLPKALFEQFRRVANLYFLFAAALSVTPSLSPVSPISTIAPLAFVVGLSMLKEGIEDFRRFLQDKKVNSRKVKTRKENGSFDLKPWEKVQVGEVVKIEKDEFFPADLLLLSSSYDDGICYVETMNLDGETNLKVKRCLEFTLGLDKENEFDHFNAVIKCEDPNPSLYTFVGNLEFHDQVYALGPEQVLLRDSKLRNTQYIYGVVIFSGFDTKVTKNSTQSPSKRSRIEHKIDRIIYLLFTVLLLISLITALGFSLLTKFEMLDWEYLEPENTSSFFDPKNSTRSGLLMLITSLILYGYLIPISLYVSLEIVKVLQAVFINQDIQMYDEGTSSAAQARTSNLNEELGQIDTILSDKTGTLTCNQMDFLKCSIAGTSYGDGATDIEIAAVKRIESKRENPSDISDSSRIDPNILSSKSKSFSTGTSEFNYSNINATSIELSQVHVESKSLDASDIGVLTGGTDWTQKDKQHGIKGFNFNDQRLMNGQWMNGLHEDMKLMFFRILAVCHTVVPEKDEESGKIKYEAESPDEAAFVIAAREFGFEFFQRTQSTVSVIELDPSSERKVQRGYKLLNLLEFNSTRKRMSVIVSDEEGQIFLLCKGADSVIFDRLGENGRQYENATRTHLAKYSEEGLRTLAFAYRKLETTEYLEWNAVFTKAKTTVGAGREALLDSASDLIEKDLVLIGATAVEDKLQKGVPGCIDKLAQAGIKIWVLTGDKEETAINIGLLRQGMKQISLCIRKIDEFQDQDDVNKAYKEDILSKIQNGFEIVRLESNIDAAFALIIDGKSLAYALEDDIKYKFLQLATNCASVICCRVSPKQKALVTKLVKESTGKTTLAIGDGANDVGMIQEADVGVGISGVEGMQAVMASDFSIAQFCFLERLLIVHGHWCYKRIAKMVCYFFYKNVAFGLTLFYYETYTSFSGLPIYDDWYMTLFNVLLTSLPVISLGVFEQDVPSEVCLQFPALYQQGPRNIFFSWSRIIGWMANGVYTSLITFFLNIYIYYAQAFRAQGATSDPSNIGATMYTCIIWAVNCQIALLIAHFTWIQHLFIWGSIFTWYAFLYVYGTLPPTVSNKAFHVLTDILGPAPIYWFITLLVTITSVLPYFTHITLQRMINPLDDHVIQEIKHFKKDIEDTEMWSREQEKAKQKTKVGFSARVDAKIKQWKGQIDHKRKAIYNSVTDTPLFSGTSPFRTRFFGKTGSVS
ncbi:probable phospholipid-transporting ATPase 4 isoform X2 [Cryptomeria japonica]|uniref:probable phospholipid-transporting ATPase 4 isoform X2 n=1 Tax=Cryptomeria japonica TaxID=3369 RepID=UPI0025AC1C86|nr:probable phospholipid-transporting ATPase 4 isoform X2 [Cryptomeria japonica]